VQLRHGRGNRCARSTHRARAERIMLFYLPLYTPGPAWASISSPAQSAFSPSGRLQKTVRLRRLVCVPGQLSRSPTATHAIAGMNNGSTTAAQQKIRGVLSDGDKVLETSEATFDYAPAYSARRGGLFFIKDPRQFKSEIKAERYQDRSRHASSCERSHSENALIAPTFRRELSARCVIPRHSRRIGDSWAIPSHVHQQCAILARAADRTMHRGDTGMIRIDFRGFSGGKSLEEISWDQWFDAFEKNNLALLISTNADKPRFNKLVSRENARVEGAGPRRKASQRRHPTKAAGADAKKKRRAARQR